MDNVKGVILAGGMASRFDGRPKGLESVGGERILDRVVQAMSLATGAPPVIVANDEAAGTWRPELTVVADVQPACGSLGGILTALVTAKGAAVCVAAWDMPFVNADLLKALIKGWKSYDAFLPASEGPLGLEPLCGVYGPTCEAHVRRSLADEDYRTTAFHDDVRVGRMRLEDVQAIGDPHVMFFNVNTPDDLAQANELWRAQYQTES